MMPKPIPLDPTLPKNFHDTPNELRSEAHLDQWWDRPYGVTMQNGCIEVLCLNGGAWDRPTHFGLAENYDVACALAEAKQAEWLKVRERPRFQLDDDQITVVRQPQRPDEVLQQLASFPTVEAAKDFLRANFPDT
jgi:hypothetical protein